MSIPHINLECASLMHKKGEEGNGGKAEGGREVKG